MIAVMLKVHIPYILTFLLLLNSDYLSMGVPQWAAPLSLS